jgi:hypothetical protein
MVRYRSLGRLHANVSHTLLERRMATAMTITAMTVHSMNADSNACEACDR